MSKKYERRPYEDYLEGEDKELYLRLVEKAKANRDADRASEALKAKIEKLQKELEELSR